MLLSPKSYKEKSYGDKNFGNDEWGKDTLLNRHIVLVNRSTVKKNKTKQNFLIKQKLFSDVLGFSREHSHL